MTTARAVTRRLHWSTRLPRNACSEAVVWAREQPSYAKAWTSCKRADWLLWLAGALCPDEATRKTIAMSACACAREALRHTRDPRVLACIETVEAWCRGAATIGAVRAARRTAYAANADAAYAATAAAADAASAAAYAAYAANAASDAARKKAYAQMAPLVREHVKRPVLEGTWKKVRRK